jgi:ribosomal protein S27AE
MVKKDKVFELRIEEDDDVSGIDSISLVDDPAIEINWMYFNRVRPQEFHIPDGEDNKYLDKLKSIAQDEQELLDEGWVVSKVTPMGKEGFAVQATDPNAASAEDETEYKVRYKYILNPEAQAPSIIPTTRDFCRELVQKNYVWRLEDMEAQLNDEGDSALVWRGGYNCRHLWARIEYTKDATIINKASVNKGKIDPQAPIDTRVLGMEQPDTRVPAHPSFSKEKMEVTTIECKKCGHKWDMKDGGEKPYMCGKCDYDNSYDMGYDVSGIAGYVDPNIKKKKKKFATDEEKRTIVGPAMVPDLRIFRKTKDGDPYEVYFSSETIKMIAEKYMKNQYTRNNDLMHDGTAVKDVYVIESWIKEDMEDKSNKYGYNDLPIGTWFVAMKVAKTPEGDKVWEMVKSGELAGFSVSGWFEEVAAFCREEMFLQKVVEILKKYD